MPAHERTVDKLQIRLIDECCRLKRVAGALPFHVAAREPPQFLLHEWRKAFECTAIARTPSQEKIRNGFGGRDSSPLI